MASLSLPVIETIRDAIIAIHKAARPSADDAWGSDLWLEARKLSRAILRLHQTAERVLNALFPTTTFGSYLDSWLRLVGAPDGLGGYGLVKLRGSSGTNAAALVAFGAVLALRGRLSQVWRLIAGPMGPRVALAGAIVALNWGLFIFAIQAGYAVEASLGYYIFPLVTVVMGVVILGERLSRAQGDRKSVV